MLNEILNNQPRCQHFHQDGSRCQASPQKNKKFCFMHDPKQKQKQAEARKKGGQTRFQPYQVKVPLSFDPGPLDSIAELRQFVARVTHYTLSGEMDQRSGRTFTYMANSILAMLNAEARERYRSQLVADKEYRRHAQEQREAQNGSERKAQKAGGEPTFFDETLEGRIMIATRQELLEYWRNKAKELAASQNPDAVAQSMRELEKLKKEEEKKQKERECYRQESEKPGYPDARPEDRSDDGNKAKYQSNQAGQAQPEAPKPPQSGDYIIYGNSPFPPMRASDTNPHRVLTDHMLEIEKSPELKRAIRSTR